MPQRRRPPAVAGQFYPAETDRLAESIDRFVDDAPSPPTATAAPAAIVSPHAGYVYSGAVAGAAFRAVRDRAVATAIVIGPSHHEVFDGASVYAGAAFETPLGSIQLDASARERLLALAPDVTHQGIEGHRAEHSVEVQVPFIQRLFPGARLLPITMAERSPELCRRIGRAIGELMTGNDMLLVASSDLYHGPVLRECEASDERTLRAMEGGDAASFLLGVREGRLQACGAGPIAVALEAAGRGGRARVEILMHRTSADVTGPDSGYVVGYGAAAVSEAVVPEATTDDELLAIARGAIEAALSGRRPIREIAARRPAEDDDTGGVFVTLRRRGQLRGCIGLTERHESIVSAIRHVACSAAFGDPRFDPLKPDELDEVTIEISLLTPLEILDPVDPSRIRVGIHGLQITHGGIHGLLLPQVAAEAGWDSRRFLEETCRKAGLPRDTWREPTTVVHVFRTRRFHEPGHAR